MRCIVPPAPAGSSGPPVVSGPPSHPLELHTNRVSVNRFALGATVRVPPGSRAWRKYLRKRKELLQCGERAVSAKSGRLGIVKGATASHWEPSGNDHPATMS